MTVDEGWEYADADTQQHVHGLHSYPARMIPQVANRIIREWSDKKDIVLDPFCGSGTVLVESLLHKRNAVGIDINPLAHLISKVKTTRINPKLMKQEIDPISEEIQQKIESFRNGKFNVKSYRFPNISHWFKTNVIDELTIIKDSITKEEDKNADVFDFLKISFSMVVRNTSNIAFKDNPYFIRAKTGGDLEKHSPDVLEVFKEQLEDSFTRVSDFYSICPKNVRCSVNRKDARYLPLDDNSVDLIVTSPPYGEESHTMAYTRFAKLSLLWFGIFSSELRGIEMRTLGGKEAVIFPLTEKIDLMLKQIGEKSEKRAKDVFSFIWDYRKSLKEMFRVLAPDSYVGIVIGGRSASGVPVSNEIITKQLGELIGFEQVATYQRYIPKKVLPRRDYKVELINKEHIIIMKKS